VVAGSGAGSLDLVEVAPNEVDLQERVVQVQDLVDHKDEETPQEQEARMEDSTQDPAYKGQIMDKDERTRVEALSDEAAEDTESHKEVEKDCKVKEADQTLSQQAKLENKDFQKAMEAQIGVPWAKTTQMGNQ